jgi:hypothetical protein
VTTVLSVVPSSREVHVVAVTAIFSDMRDLLISAWVERKPLDDHAVQVVFQRVHGFRVLDERDLVAFWKEGTGFEKGAWLYEVASGGWRDLESSREWFSTPEIFPEVREYLVVGERCVSVLAGRPPVIASPREGEALPV